MNFQQSSTFILVALCGLTSRISCGFLGFPQPGVYLNNFQSPPVFGRNVVPLPIPSTPRHYYSPPGNTYRGFSYHNDYPNGGSSQVVFMTGPQSTELVREVFRRENLPLIQSFARSANDSTVLSTTPASLPTPSQAPLATDAVASVYRVQVFPSNLPHIVRAPFPYDPYAFSFYHPLAQPAVRPATPVVSTRDNTPEGQESMIREVEAIPAIASNHIDSSTKMTETSSEHEMSTSSESTTEPAGPVPTTSANETPSDRSTDITDNLTTVPSDLNENQDETNVSTSTVTDAEETSTSR